MALEGTPNPVNVGSASTVPGERYRLMDVAQMKLYDCRSEDEQIAWAVEHLKKGGRIHDISLWLGGVDRPMQIVAGVKRALRAEGKGSSRPWKRSAMRRVKSMTCWLGD